MIANTNDGSTRPANLRIYMSLYAVNSMAQFADRSRAEQIAAIHEAGYEGVQFYDAVSTETLAQCQSLGLGVVQSDRISFPNEADAIAERYAAEGVACGTIHLGWGLEDEDEGARLIEAVLSASVKHKMPLYVETHRATLFEDIWRTVQFVKRFPEIRFNGDFSHWYTGHEMVYGDFDWKLAYIAPVLERVRFIHGRISDPGCMQAYVGDGSGEGRPYVGHFKQFWTSAFAGFLASAEPGDYICFAPELLQPEIYYGRTYPNAAGERVEEFDRWEQSLVHAAIAKECFAKAAEKKPPRSE